MHDLPKTIFIDIDGTILKHLGTLQNMMWSKKAIATQGAVEKMNYWYNIGYRIIITTARPESMRIITEKQLYQCGIVYHTLIMSLPVGPRVVINDKKPQKDEDMAISINLTRDEGLEHIEI